MKAEGVPAPMTFQSHSGILRFTCPSDRGYEGQQGCQDTPWRAPVCVCCNQSHLFARLSEGDAKLNPL